MIRTSHDCDDTQCNIVGEMQGSHTSAPGKTVTLRDSLEVSEKPNGKSVGTGATRGN